MKRTLVLERIALIYEKFRVALLIIKNYSEFKPWVFIFANSIFCIPLLYHRPTLVYTKSNYSHYYWMKTNYFCSRKKRPSKLQSEIMKKMAPGFF